MLLKDKRVLITGANRGIGAEIAKTFVAQGAHVALNHPDDEKNWKLAEALIAQLGGGESKIFSVPADVSQAQDVAAMFEVASKELGGIDILINNAGITRDGLIMRMKDEDWDSVIAVNLKGVFNCCRQAAKYMLKTPKSKIINISSVVGQHGNAGQVNYSASKAGVIGITKSLAKEFSSRGVCVNAIAPGFIQTDMTDVLPDKVREKMLESVPLGRIGTAADVANAALFLASGLSDYITGQIIVVDGGMTI